MEPLNTQNSPAGESNKMLYAWIIGVIAILVLVFVGYRMYKKNSPSGSDKNLYGQEETADDTTKVTGNIEVEDQLPGDIVYLTSVSLSQPGFVVVSVAKGTDMGKVIGSKNFPEGKNPGQIVVSEKTKEGQTYAVSLYADDGDGVFDAKKDHFIVVKNFRATKYLDYIKG